MRTRLILSLLLGSMILSGCANLISASREEPITEDHGNRTIGSYVDDELIETKAQVNLLEAREALQGASISVTSFNGLVLLTGQAPSEDVRQNAERIVSQVRKVRRIHNEISVSGSTSAIATANDVWITSKVKAQLLINEAVPGHRIKVVTEAGTVYLMGLVSQAEADAAVAVVSSLGGVQRIIKIFEYINHR